MNTYPFSLYKRADRPYFLVSFKNADGKFLAGISTKKKNEEEALAVALLWLRDGVPQTKEKFHTHELILKETAKKIKTATDAEALLTEMKRLGWVKNGVVKDTQAAVCFITFLKNFWDWENSKYVKEKLRKSHGLHKTHCIKQGQAVSLFWEPFFKERYLGDITAADIDAFINHMGEKKLSASRKNIVIKAGFKALRWAFSKGMIEIDPTRGHLLFSGDEIKRNILTPMIVRAIFSIPWKNESTKLGNMLGAVTGMRAGEILALRFQDLGTNCLYIQHSWNRMDKLKLTKTNEARTVEVPFPDLMNGLIVQAKKNPWGIKPDSFVFWSENSEDKPMHEGLFRKWLRIALVNIGYSDNEAKKYLFHGWRHFYTSYMVNKVGKKLVKSQTGQKTDVMVAHYSDHETDGDKELIQAASRETFAGLLPQKILLLEYKGNDKTAAA